MHFIDRAEANRRIAEDFGSDQVDTGFHERAWSSYELVADPEEIADELADAVNNSDPVVTAAPNAQDAPVLIVGEEAAVDAMPGSNDTVAGPTDADADPVDAVVEYIDDNDQAPEEGSGENKTGSDPTPRQGPNLKLIVAILILFYI